MPTTRKLLFCLAATFTCLLIQPVSAAEEGAEQYHQGAPGKYAVVLALIYEITDGTNAGREVYKMPVGGGFLSSDGMVITSGQSAGKIRNYLQKLNSVGAALSLEDNERPVIKIFSRQDPTGIGYIRTLPVDTLNSSWSSEQIVKLPFTTADKIKVSNRSPINISDTHLPAHTFRVYRSIDYRPYHEDHDGKRMAQLKFQYDPKDTLCDQHQCQNSRKLSFSPVMARKDKGEFFLYGFTSDCNAGSPCQIMRADVSQENAPLPEKGPEPDSRGAISLKAIAALTTIFVILVGAQYLFDLSGYPFFSS